MNKLLGDLKEKFPLKEVAPYGFCLVVPGAEFDPDWEAELGDKGYRCFQADLDGKPVTLVRVVKSEKGSGEKTVYVPPEPEDPKTVRSFWTPKEDDVLATLWNSGVPFENMPKSLPGRTETAIRLRVQRLERYGKIKKRGRGKKVRTEKPVDTQVHTPVDTQRAQLISLSKVEGLLEEIFKAVKPKLEFINFETYCPACSSFNTVEDENVWKVCPVCGGPLIIWNVQASQEAES